MSETQEKFEAIFKEYDFLASGFREKFNQLDEKEQMVICKELEEQWTNGRIKPIYDEILNGLFKEIACKAENMEVLSELRRCACVFKDFENLINWYIKYRENKIKNLDIGIVTGKQFP